MSTFKGRTDRQGMKQFRGRCFIMSVFSHPVQHPSIDIVSVTCDVQCCVELKNKLFIPIYNVRAKVQEACVMKHTEDRREARQGFHVHMRNVLVVEDFILVEEQ